MDELFNVPINYIHTTKGNKPINEIGTLDLIYDYGTGKVLYIRDIKETSVDEIYKLTFNDGRFAFYGGHEYFPDHNDPITINDIIQIMEINNMTTSDRLDKLDIGFKPNHPIMNYSYSFSHGLKQSNPDAYTAGALLIYGDFHSKYMNIPSDSLSVINNICYKYHMEPYDIGNNHTGFKYKNHPRLVRWDEFFPQSVMDFIHMRTNEIPIEYSMADISSRVQFIAGVLDTNGMISSTNLYPYILSTDEHKLRSLQPMIWSIGGTSSILRYDDLDMYQLTLFYPIKKISNLFYDTEKKSQGIINALENNLTPDPVTILTNIEFCGTGKLVRIETDFRDSIYLTGNFIPRCSII